MSDDSDQVTPGTTGNHLGRKAGQRAGRNRRVTPRMAVVGVCVLIVLALGTAAVVHRRATLDLGQRCGTIIGGQPAIPTSAADAHTDIACFTHAYAHCTAASLNTTHAFGDGSSKDTFVVVPGQGAHGSCGLVVQWSTYIVGSNHTTSGQEHCAGLAPRGDVLTFQKCGILGDVRVPTDI